MHVYTVILYWDEATTYNTILIQLMKCCDTNYQVCVCACVCNILCVILLLQKIP